MKKVWVPILVVIVVVAVIGLRMRRSGSAEGPADFATVQVERGPIEVLVSASGVLEPIYQVDVKSKASGLIERMPVEEGDRVREGDLLADLDRTEVQTQYDQAAANLASARANLRYLQTQLKRQTELYDQHLISDLEMDETNLNLVQAESQKVGAEAALTSAKQRLDDTVVRSPINGVVLLKSVEAGQIISSGINSVSGGTTIAVVADMSQMLVKTSVDEVDIGNVEVGQQASVIPDAFPDWVSTGQVIRIAPQGLVEQNVTTFQVTVRIPNPDLKLKSGMNCSVDLSVAEREDALLLPLEAVGTSTMIPRWQALIPDLQVPGPPGGGKKPLPNGGSPRGSAGRQLVIVMDEGRPSVRPVKVGLNDLECVEIVEGLAEGDEVILASHSRALEARAAFQDRMRARSMGGFRRSN